MRFAQGSRDLVRVIRARYMLANDMSCDAIVWTQRTYPRLNMSKKLFGIMSSLRLALGKGDVRVNLERLNQAYPLLDETSAHVRKFQVNSSNRFDLEEATAMCRTVSVFPCCCGAVARDCCSRAQTPSRHRRRRNDLANDDDVRATASRTLRDAGCRSELSAKLSFHIEVCTPAREWSKPLGRTSRACYW